MGLWETLGLDMERHRLLAFVGGGGKTTNIYALANEARQAGKTVIVTTSTHMMPHPGLFLAAANEGTGLSLLLERYGIVTVGQLSREDKMTGAEDLTACKRAADVVLVEADGARLRPLKAPADHEPVIPPEADGVVAVCGMDCLGRVLGETCHRPERVSALLDKPPEGVITPADVARILLSDQGSRKHVDARAFCCILNKADTEARRIGAVEIATLLGKAGVPAAITSYTEEEQGGGIFPTC